MKAIAPTILEIKYEIKSESQKNFIMATKWSNSFVYTVLEAHSLESSACERE